MLKGNAIIGQSGGPTSVINSSLAGVIDKVGELEGIERVFGMNYGIEGFMNEQLLDLDAQPESVIKGLRTTPGSALGSSRLKLQGDHFPKILEVLKKFDIRYFFLIGGNDTMDTVHRVEAYCREQGYDLIGVGIPKTVDNDLYGTDHTPGFPSAARCNVLSVLQSGWLARDMKKVDGFVVYQTIGRDAGWLAAATALAKRKDDDAPHLIYCPERTFNKDEMIEDAKACIEKYGWVSIVVSEGLCYADGSPVSASQTADKFDNVEFGAMGGASVGLNIHRMLTDELGLRGEFQITESLIMSAHDRATAGDLEEAFRCGQKAVELAAAGESGYMVSMKRVSNDPYTIEYDKAPLSDVAVRAKGMPDDFITERGNWVTEKLLDYMRPLITDIPEYVELEKIYAQPKG
jgi:ATP-dependent phosphofructokinase / diphosphate-dependent phosphofructokinase